jgi:hypothetical protein
VSFSLKQFSSDVIVHHTDTSFVHQNYDYLQPFPHAKSELCILY